MKGRVENVCINGICRYIRSIIRYYSRRHALSQKKRGLVTKNYNPHKTIKFSDIKKTLRYNEITRCYISLRSVFIQLKYHDF